MKLILSISLALLACRLSADNHRKETDKVKETETVADEAYKESHVESLTLYKDRCLATMRVNTPKDKKNHSLKVPGTIDPESVLFGHVAGELPAYSLCRAEGENSAAELKIARDLGFDGRVDFSFTGMDWRPHYVIELNGAFDKVINFNGFIGVDNKSGVDFTGIRLRVVDARTDNAPANQCFREYAFDTPRTLVKGEITRLPWIALRDLPCSRDYRLELGGENLKDLGGAEKAVFPRIWLKFDDALHKNLASGEIKFYVKDDSGTLRYIGSGVLPNSDSKDGIGIGVPSDLSTQLKSGEESPLSRIKASLEQTEFKVLLTEKISEAAYRLNVRNYGDKEVTVKAVLPFGCGRGKVIRENAEHVLEGENAVCWAINVKPKSETVLRYRVQLTRKE